MRLRVGVAALAVLTVAATALACTKQRDSDRNAPAAPQTPTNRPFCEVALPESWRAAIEGSEINTGGVSTIPVAVGRTGEVAAVRDNGDTRDLLLIGADKSVAEIYPVPDPNLNNVGFVAMDDRWMVVGVDRIPRGSNGVLPGLIRIDVIDRQGQGVQTIAQQSEDDYGTGRNALDSVALFDGKVYWITRDTYAGDTGTLRSHDLGTGAVTDVESGALREVRTTAAGLTWVVGTSRGDGLPWWRRTEVKAVAALPPPVADAVGTGQDRLSLATDGTAYAWITGLDQGGTGVAWWSPTSGQVRVTGEIVSVKQSLPRVYVAGPYVVIKKGRPETDTVATVVDTRSGAVTFLDNYVADADGGTIAMQLGPQPRKGLSMPGVVRADALQPLAC